MVDDNTPDSANLTDEDYSAQIDGLFNWLEDFNVEDPQNAAEDPQNAVEDLQNDAEDLQNELTDLKQAVTELAVAVKEEEAFDSEEDNEPDQEINAYQSDLISQIRQILNNYSSDKSAKKVENLKFLSQQLIEREGFSVFKDAVDDMLLQKETRIQCKHDKQFAKGMKRLNEYLTDVMTDTLGVVILEGAKIQATGILAAIDKSDKSVQELAVSLAEKDGYKKGLALEQMKADRAISALQSNGEMGDEEKRPAIQKIQSALESYKNGTPRPMDYYIEQARIVNLKEKREFFLPASAQQSDMAINFIKDDVLAKPTVAQRTLAMERYVLAAEKFLAEENIDGAFAVFSMLTSVDAGRLHVTKNGLSSHAHELLNKMNVLFNPEKNSNSMVQYATTHDKAYILPATIAVWMEGTIVEFGAGDVTNNAGIKALETNSKKILGIANSVSFENVNEQLAAKITEQKYNFSTCTTLKDVQVMSSARAKSNSSLGDDLFGKSLDREPRNTELEPSTIIKKVKGLLRPSVPYEQLEETRERSKSLIERVEAQLTKVQSKWEQFKEKIGPHADEKAENRFVSLFKSLSAFIHEAKDTLLWNKKETKAPTVASIETLDARAVELKQMHTVNLVREIYKVIGTLVKYNDEHGGNEQYRSQFDKRYEDLNMKPAEQKRFYSAYVINELQQIIQSQANPNVITQCSFQIQAFITGHALQNSSLINSIIGKEHSFVSLIEKEVVPILNELQSRPAINLGYHQKKHELMKASEGVTKDASADITAKYKSEVRKVEDDAPDTEIRLNR